MVLLLQVNIKLLKIRNLHTKNKPHSFSLRTKPKQYFQALTALINCAAHSQVLWFVSFINTWAVLKIIVAGLRKKLGGKRPFELSPSKEFKKTN